MPLLDRRILIAGALAMGAMPRTSLAAVPAGGRLRFNVFRNGRPIGHHQMSFVANGDAIAVTTEAEMVIKLGPVPVFKYAHHCEERWKGGRIAELHSRTDSNGKIETVAASRTASALVIDATTAGKISAPAAVQPLSHWNSAVLDGPLFNPQTGKLLKVSATAKGREQIALASGAMAPAIRWMLRGETNIDDWYDANGVWVALRGLLDDKSTMEYKRV